jgi:hypothetical protein
MKKFNPLFAILTLVYFGLFSCEQKSKGTNETPEQLEVGNVTKTLAERKMQEFEALDPTSFNLVKSLRWEEAIENDPRFLEVDAYLNADGYPVKIIEYFSDGNYKEEGQRIYYLDQNEVYAIVKRYDEWPDSNYAVFHEKQVFYENNQAILARHRTSVYAEDIEQEPWNTIRIEDLSNMNEVMDILNGEGRFKTHYLSYIQANDELFLLVGEPSDGARMQTAVMVTEMSPFMEQLLSNSKQNKFKPLLITFDVVGGQGTPEYRAIKTIDWAK